MCDCKEWINAYRKKKNQAPLLEVVSIKSKQQQQKKLKYAKILRQFLFQLMPDKTICRTRHSNVFTALYIKIDHLIVS